MTAVIDVSGRLCKMPASAAEPVDYTLKVGDTRIPLNDLIGHPLRLDYDGVIRCIHCDRTTKKVSTRVIVIPVFASWQPATAAS